MDYKVLNFLKKIFQNEQEAPKPATEISLSNLEGWLNEKSKPLMEEIEQQIEEILMKVNEELERARMNVEVLENAKLQNPNIPFRAKQYMEGNRKAYIRAVNSFFGHMEINNRDYFYLVDFCKLFDELLNGLNKGTFRSYAILQEFFANETSRIAQNIRNFDKIFSGLKSVLNNDKMAAVNDLMKKIKSMEAKTKQKINLDLDFKSAEASVKLGSKEKEEVMASIEKFNNSEEHNSFLKLNEEKKNKALAFYNDENQFLQAFSNLDRPLRKYSHIAFEHEEIVLDYLKSPIETLANDRNFAVIEILKNLEKSLNENRIQIDDRKKEKSLEEIKKLSREFLEQFLKKYYSFKSEIQELEDKIKRSGVSDKFRDFNKQLESINFKIEKDNEEYKRLKEDVVKLTASIDSLKKEVEGSFKESFGEEVGIVV
ncbi:hypothetical protein HYW20_00320 [Candidatus Woesearchaeota archaeon]|nr:hypothetical protein [Candidatus Woesearchaeota archaeon]